MPDKPHYHGHRQRLRERFLKTGADGLAEYELLELLLMQAIPRRDVKPLAKELLQTFGSFNNLLEAPFDKLAAQNGLSEEPPPLPSSSPNPSPDIPQNQSRKSQHQRPFERAGLPLRQNDAPQARGIPRVILGQQKQYFRGGSPLLRHSQHQRRLPARSGQKSA